MVATYIAGHPELIEVGVNGWLVPAGAVEPLVDAMAEVLKAEPAVLEEMGQAARTEWRNSTIFTEKPGNSSSCSRVHADLHQGSPGTARGRIATTPIAFARRVINP